MKKKGKDDIWGMLLREKTSDSYYHMTLGPPNSLTSPLPYEQHRILCSWGLLSVFSQNTTHTHARARKVDTANPKLALHFKRTYGSPLFNTTQFFFSFWDKKPWLFTFIFSALSTMPCTQKALINGYCHVTGTLVNTLLTLWATSFIFSILR